LTFLLCVLLLVLGKSFGKLVGAGSVSAALNAGQLCDDVVDFHSDGKSGNTLRIAAATVHEFQRRQNIVFDFEDNLTAASAVGSVRFHSM
jgi:predicted deacylase